MICLIFVSQFSRQILHTRKCLFFQKDLPLPSMLFCKVVNDIGGRDMSLSKIVERHHCLRHVEMSSDIFKNVDVENVEIFELEKFKHLSTKNSFVAQGLFTCY
jgi:hypothetical protein